MSKKKLDLEKYSGAAPLTFLFYLFYITLLKINKQKYFVTSLSELDITNSDNKLIIDNYLLMN